MLQNLQFLNVALSVWSQQQWIAPFLQVQLFIVAIQAVEQECSQSIAKEGGEGLPSAFCSLSVFVEEHRAVIFVHAI